MKALSIRQPWATMIILGHKPVENRNWKAKHRGPLFIHAALTWDQDGANWILENFPNLSSDVDRAKQLRGGIIGSVIMTDCVSSHPSPWYTGDWGFVFTSPKSMPLRPWKGKLAFFEVPACVGCPLEDDPACGNFSCDWPLEGRPQAAKEG